MDAGNLALAQASGLVPASYLAQGALEAGRRRALVRELLASRGALPEAGWGEAAIEAFVRELAAMDSNAAASGVGAGEREGRVHSALVRARHYGFAHGVGRSGDLTAAQPKAPGSSLLQALCNRLALHAARACGLLRTRAVLVLPLATGMSLALCLRAAAAPRGAGARYVLWPRCDQRSCLKSILTAGLLPCVVENVEEGQELRTDMRALAAAVEACGGAACIAAVLTTTSCFAPRAPDRVVEVARLCAALDIPHVINHAYGLQAAGLCGVVNEACRGWPQAEGGGGGGGGSSSSAPPPALTDPAPCRVDAWVSSTDKNFMVPVGGALVGSPSAAFVAAVSALYPGRASLSPILDLFMTLLGLGRSGLLALLAQRKQVFQALGEALRTEAAAVGESVLASPHNPISMGLTLGRLCGSGGSGGSGGSSSKAVDEAATYIGSMLFSRGVSGTRVVPRGKRGVVEGLHFPGYGSHCNDYAHGPYLTAAAAVGMTVEDVGVFAQRLRRVLKEFIKERRRGEGEAGGGAEGGGQAAAPAVAEGGGADQA